MTAGTLLEQGAKKSGMKKKILAKIEHTCLLDDSAPAVSQLKLRLFSYVSTYALKQMCGTTKLSDF